MLTTACWIGYHDHCEASEFCDCLCHPGGDVDWDLEAMTLG